jgi:hypothetical protein
MLIMIAIVVSSALGEWIEINEQTTKTKVE